MNSIESLEDKAEQTLRNTDTFRAPVPIHLVAQRLNLGTEALPLGEFSGMMVVRGNQGATGYNSAHARVPQSVHHCSRNCTLRSARRSRWEGAAIRR